MNLESWPTEFECSDECGDVFKLSAFDEHTATIEISTVISKESWPVISNEIQRCLNEMFKDRNQSIKLAKGVCNEE